jgi:hypothetical protein
MEKVPPTPPTLAIVGGAVRVKGAVAAAALLTVMVPVLVVVLAGVVVNTGDGAKTVGVAPLMVKFNVLVFPIGVVTPMFLIPTVAAFVMLRVAVTWEESVTTKEPVARETPPVSPVSAVAPVRLLPTKVTGTDVPRTPATGAIEVISGPSTVKGITLVLVPPGVVMETFLTELAAVAVMLKVAVT